MAEDYYQILNVSKSASQEDIQKAYRKLARKYHPDLHADKDESEKKRAKQKFQQIQQAYDVLSDPKKRNMYDQLGPDFENMGGANPFTGGAGGMPPNFDFSQIFGGGTQRGGAGGFEDILRQFGMGTGGDPGGRRPRPGRPQKGQDLEESITVPFNTAVLGGDHQVTFQKPDGKVEKIRVRIPAGIEHGKKIRLRGQGMPGYEGAGNGDLFIRVNVAPHPNYTRSGLNLHVTVPVTLSESVAGAKIDLPTPHGTLAVSVPPGSSGGKTLRLKGMGIHSGDRKGDLLVQLQIALPEGLGEADLDAVRQIDSHWNGKTPRSDLRW